MSSLSSQTKQKIKHFLNKLENDPAHTDDCIDFFQALVLNRQETPPVLEMLTIIKHEKPLLFLHLKNRMRGYTHFRLMLELSMDLQKAWNVLHE